MNKIRMTILAVVIIVLLLMNTIALASDTPDYYVFLPLVMSGFPAPSNPKPEITYELWDNVHPPPPYYGGKNMWRLLPPLSIPPFGGGEIVPPIPFP